MSEDLDDIAAEESLKETLEHVGETMAASSDPQVAATGRSLLKSLYAVGFYNAANSDDPVGNYFVEVAKAYLTILAGAGGTAAGGPPGGIAASLGTAIALEYLDTRGEQSIALNIAILEDGISVSSDGTTAINITTDEATGNTVVDIYDPEDPDYRVQITKDSEGNVVGAVSDIGRFKIEENLDGTVTITDEMFDTTVTVSRDDSYAQAAFNDQKQHVNNDYLPEVSDAGAGANVIDGGNGVGTVINDDIMITSDGNGNTTIDTVNTIVERGSDGEIRIMRIDTQTNEVGGVILKPNGDTVCFLPSNGAGSPLDIYRGDPSTWPQSAQDACAGIITDAANDIVQGLRDLAEGGFDVMSALLPHGLAETLNDLFSKVTDDQGVFGDIAGWVSDAWNAFWAAWNNGSPLVLDLDGDGVELVSLANSSVYWDIDEDGFAEASGWVQTDDGLLAIDANNDGIITDHSELFGSVDEDGFADLRLLDSNSDNVINASDAAFADLLVWRDLNQNGYSEANELFSLADLDIVSINLNATAVNQTNEGHHISHVSTYTVDDGVSGPQNLSIVDVWFQYDDINSSFVGDYTLDLASLFTVNQRGYGTLPDLYIAASMDNDLNDPDSLLSLLTAFSAKTLDELFVDDGSIMDEVRTIMLRWAGVDDVDPASRGQWVDAQELEFLEGLFGQEFLQQDVLPNPGGGASYFLDMAFDIAQNAIAARLIAQGAGSQIFSGAFYNPVTDSFDGFTGFDQEVLDALITKSLDPAAVTDKTAFWMQVVNVVDQAVGVANLSAGDLQVLNDTLAASDFTLTADQLLERIQWALDINLGTSYTGDYLQGTSSDDVLVADASNDTILAGNGNDSLSGGLGDDILTAGNGNDILFGGLGNDRLDGDNGVDLYKYYAGHGDDIVWESASDIDTLEFGPGITLSDLEIYRVSNTALRIGILPSAGTGSVTVELGNLEILKFADNSTFDLRTMDQTLTGTSGNDTLRGMLAGSMGTGSDYLYGLDGNDILYADAGNETDTKVNWLYGGNGDDSLYGDAGNDELYGEADNDTLTGYGGHDLLVGGLGNDTVNGGAGDDRYIFNYGDGNDTYYDTGGADRIVFGAGITVADLDVWRISNNDVIISIDGGLGGSIVVTGETIGNNYIIETLEFADSSTVLLASYDLTLTGTSAGETLYGVNYGGSGVDTIYGLGGDDNISGYRSSPDTKANFLYGGDGNDSIYGANGVDYIEGNDGNDTLRGYSGDDLLLGGDGADIVMGDNGNDVLIGGLGADELTGGSGNDVFRFAAGESFDAVDTVKDFNTTYDALDVSEIIDFDPMTDVITDFVQITTSGANSLLAVDADGGGDNFVQIAVILNKTGLTDEAALLAGGQLLAA